MNEEIAYLVDSAGSLPRGILKEYQIMEVPFYYTFDGKTYFRENVDGDNADFFRHMQEHPQQVPHTAAPNVNDWMQAFQKVGQQGFRKIIVTTISSGLSASFQNAHLARNMYLSSEEAAEIEIEVMTSSSCACGQAALEIKIAQMIHENQLSWEEICLRAKALIPGLTTLFTVKNLIYMKAGGRIGGATAFMGRLINIKPICEFINGVVRPLKAVRGSKKALMAMADECCSRIKQVANPVICTQNALCEEDETFMIDYLHSLLGYDGPIYRGMLGAVVGAHSGPGSIGIGYVGES
ncbi:MAG TPA: DegV family protein [Syntrophomonadaceae bacterium]|nr:DegV family protein [Syntrophomonadaceae bacterium]